MLEAKVALKCLFELLIDSKRELQNQSEKGYQAKYEEIKEAHDRLTMEYDLARSEYERQLVVVKMQNEQKLSALVALQRGVVGRGDRNEACKQLQNVIQTQQERLRLMEEENHKLVEELEQIRSQSKNKRKKSPTNKTKTEYMDPTDEEDYDFEDNEKDPDWRATPLFKRIQAHRSRLTMNFTESTSQDTSRSNPEPSRAVKRTSDGATHCTCRGHCANKLCGCVKNERGCGSACRCQRDLCKNRRNNSDSDDKENNPSSTDISLNTTPPSFFDKRNHLDQTYVKKKKPFFFSNDQGDGVET